MTDKGPTWYAEIDFYEDGSYRQTNGSSFNHWLRKVKAEAWSKGYAGGQDSVYTSENEFPADIKNPYVV